jgi:GTP-binding protein
VSRRVQYEARPNVHRGEAASLGTLAIVGRPNVGKSTLFNRLVGSRRAIVGDEPGITRDRLYGDVEWAGRHLRVVDTGGIIPDDKALIPSEIFRQARVALEEANAIVMVVDGRTELAAPDMELARLLLRSGKPVLLAVNKVDTVKLEPYAEEFRRLGIQQLFPISAENGNGLAELLDYVLTLMPQPTAEEEETSAEEVPEKSSDNEAEPEPKEVKVAIIGRPNVGKSTLLNALTGTARAIVSPVAGTTRDAVDEVLERDGQTYRFIDTAGIRRKGKTELMAEKLSVVMARKHLEAADVALILIDAVEGVTASDATIAGYAHESGRSVIIVVNKWDLVTTNRTDGKPPADRKVYEEQLRYHLKFLNYAPVVFVSAVKGQNMDQLFSTLELVARERRKRIGTGEMNRFISRVDFERASVPMSKRVKILYMTQAAVSPPTFILFTDRAVKLHFSYQRFLENQIREAFGFVGTPIWIKNRGGNEGKRK